MKDSETPDAEVVMLTIESLAGNPLRLVAPGRLARVVSMAIGLLNVLVDFGIDRVSPFKESVKVNRLILAGTSFCAFRLRGIKEGSGAFQTSLRCHKMPERPTNHFLTRAQD